jgi:hypothetical protein
MIDLVEIYQMKQEIYKKKVDSYVISSIYRRKPTIFSGFAQYFEHFSTKSVRI